MESSGDKLFKFGVVLVFGLVALAAALVVLNQQKTAAEQAVARSVDVAEELARLHQRAAQGALKLDGSEKLEMRLIQAGFPPKRPILSLEPRARLKGGATATVDGHTVSVAHYAAEDSRLTLFLLPLFAEAIPSTAATIVRHRAQLSMARRGPVTVVFWKRGHWITAVATEGSDSVVNAFVDLVWFAERRF
ncbi:MAG: hypothetical protein ACOX6T_06755 [Myxococcales bacterium]|jgi:hypothetical protein